MRLLSVAVALPIVASEWECPAGSIASTTDVAACCPGHCGGKCDELAGGRQACYVAYIKKVGRMCNVTNPPCIPSQHGGGKPRPASVASMSRPCVLDIQRAELNFRGASGGVTRAIQALRDRFDQFISPFIPARVPVLFECANYGSNFGDILITMGALRLLHRFASEVVLCKGRHPHGGDVDCKYEDYRDSLVVFKGGGSWGDLYTEAHSNRREKILAAACRHNMTVVSMPQSIFWDHEPPAVEASWNAALQPCGHRVTLTWRQANSFEQARKLYTNVKHVLLPDVAAYFGGVDFASTQAQLPVLALRRGDNESTQRVLVSVPGQLAVTDWRPIASKDDAECAIKLHPRVVHEIQKWGARFPFVSTLKRVIYKLNQGRIVVTDRLHATLFADLLGIPVVAIDQIYQKVHHTRSVLEELCGWPKAMYASNFEEAVRIAMGAGSGSARNRAVPR